jgi:pyruvate-formate lyase-activating enzyme
VHLLEILRLRPIPAAAVLLTLTRRCPLTCAHCSTSSLMDSEEHDAEMFVRFVDTFTPADRPEVLLLTGGEPLLRPELVATLTRKAHAVGTRVGVVSGMFFARAGRIPPALDRVVAEVDHFTASLDRFHQEQVPLEGVLRVLDRLVERGTDVSCQVVGVADDGSLEEITGAVRRHFGDRVPMLVSTITPVGRATTWLERGGGGAATSIPCGFAAWPTVAADGTVLACGNQTAMDGPAPAHLRLGHIARDDWPAVRARCAASPMLRAIRRYGPLHLAELGVEPVACDGYCTTCLRLSRDPGLGARMEAHLAENGSEKVDALLQSLQQETLDSWLLRGEYGALARLGYAGAAQ